MNAGFDDGPAQLRAAAVAVPGPYFGEKFATSSKKACFPYDLALSIEHAYIDCIFCRYIDCIFFFLSNTNFRFYFVL